MQIDSLDWRPLSADFFSAVPKVETFSPRFLFSFADELRLNVWTKQKQKLNCLPYLDFLFRMLGLGYMVARETVAGRRVYA